jgi:hypothetical protein
MTINPMCTVPPYLGGSPCPNHPPRPPQVVLPVVPDEPVVTLPVMPERKGQA